MSTPRTTPWKKPRPAAAKKTKLTPRSIARAKTAAKRAGRRYPNLVDNMRAAAEQREAEQRQAARKTGPKAKRARGDHP
jgi:hypothetical protein